MKCLSQDHTPGPNSLTTSSRGLQEADQTKRSKVISLPTYRLPRQLTLGLKPAEAHVYPGDPKMRPIILHSC